MDRFTSITDEDVACLVQENDSDNTKTARVYSGAVSNMFVGGKAM